MTDVIETNILLITGP